MFACQLCVRKGLTLFGGRWVGGNAGGGLGSLQTPPQMSPVRPILKVQGSPGSVRKQSSVRFREQATTDSVAAAVSALSEGAPQPDDGTELVADSEMEHAAVQEREQQQQQQREAALTPFQRAVVCGYMPHVGGGMWWCAMWETVEIIR